MILLDGEENIYVHIGSKSTDLRLGYCVSGPVMIIYRKILRKLASVKDSRNRIHASYAHRALVSASPYVDGNVHIGGLVKFMAVANRAVP